MQEEGSKWAKKIEIENKRMVTYFFMINIFFFF